MPIEIERKYLLKSDQWRAQNKPQHSVQGYLAPGPPASLRVRIMGGIAKLNIKQSVIDIERDEYEYPLPLTDAQEMLESLCTGSIVEKNRYRVEYEGFIWEIDEFLGENAGLIVAEIELEHREQTFPKPPWLGEEVSQDIRYYNTYLSKHPYSTWSD